MAGTVSRSTILVMELVGMQVSTGFAASLRGRAAALIRDGGVLPELSLWQVLIRDGYVGYTHLTNVLHAWCGAHLLRDLRGIHEADPAGQLWAKALADLARPGTGLRLAQACRQDTSSSTGWR